MMKLSGPMVVRLMRRHKRTIRGVAQAHQITMKRVREVRSNGVEGFAAEEWIYIVTGRWPGDGVDRIEQERSDRASVMKKEAAHG